MFLTVREKTVQKVLKYRRPSRFMVRLVRLDELIQPMTGAVILQDAPDLFHTHGDSLFQGVGPTGIEIQERHIFARMVSNPLCQLLWCIHHKSRGEYTAERKPFRV